MYKKYLTAVIALASICILAGACSQTEPTIIIEDTQLSKYTGTIFLNNDNLDSSNMIMVNESGDIYLSTFFLNDSFGFQLQDDMSYLQVRRLSIPVPEIVSFDGDFYVPLSLISKYIYLNENLLEYGNTLQMGKVMPTNIKFNERSYQSVADYTSDMSKIGELVDVSEDGRGIFSSKDNSNTIWVEGEDRYWLYCLPDWDIN